jgi:hypothetical protein
MPFGIGIDGKEPFWLLGDCGVSSLDREVSNFWFEI